MLEKVSGVPDGVIALKAVGTVTTNDYEQAVEPMLDQARSEDRRLRILLQLGPEYQGFTPGVAWEKTGMVLRNPSLWRWVDGYALVSDIRWVGELIHLSGFLTPFPMRMFGNDEFDAAVDWLTSLPEGPGVSHRLLPESGIILVEVTEPLRTQDFDALAATADAWLDAHEELPGVVIHAHAFPGWENVEGLLHHIRFVRDHHHRVRRVALAADSPLAALAPRLADHFVQAEVKAFGYHQLATQWRGPRARRATLAG